MGYETTSPQRIPTYQSNIGSDRTNPLSKNHTLHIVKLGQRLLLVSAGESEVTCLSEITDPVEIEQLLTSATTTLPSCSTFKSLFAQYDQDTNQLFTDP